LLGEKGVLKIGGVRNAGSEQNGSRVVTIGAIFWRERLKRGEQDTRVVVHGPDAVVAKHGREYALEDFAISEHVGDAARHAKIVFENREVAVGKANKIGAADTDVDIARNIQAAHLAAEVFAAINEFPGDDAIGEDAAFVIDVSEEKVEGSEALSESFFDFGPFAGRDDAGEKIVGEDALGAFLAAVNGEGDAFVEEGEVGGLLAAAKLFGRETEKGVLEGAVVFARDPGREKHLVIGSVELIVHKRRWQTVSS
jgi:hypothetical protein